jgi:potassium voltage-gated channel Eag-related subfamily H protein 8
MIFPSLWQLVMTLVLLISVFLTPFNLAFDKYNDPIDYPSYAVLLNTIDALFWMDFLVQFFLVTEKEDGSPEDDRKEIVINYLRGWFAIDFCSNFPFDKIIEAI